MQRRRYREDGKKLSGFSISSLRSYACISSAFFAILVFFLSQGEESR